MLSGRLACSKLRYQNKIWHSQPMFKQIETNVLSKLVVAERYILPSRSKGYGRESGNHTETVAEKIPAIYKTGKYIRKRTFTRRKRFYRIQLDRKRTNQARRFNRGTRADNETEPDSLKRRDLIQLFTENYHPKRNTYHIRTGFVWQSKPEVKDQQTSGND